MCSDFGPFDRLAGQIAWSKLTNLERNRVTRSEKGDSGFPCFYGRKVGEGRKTRAIEGRKFNRMLGTWHHLPCSTGCCVDGHMPLGIFDSNPRVEIHGH